MPAWVDTPAKEQAWTKAKRIVREQRDKTEDDFSSRDWGLVTHIAKRILSSSASNSPPATDQTRLLLAHVEYLLEARRHRAKQDKDRHLPQDAKLVVDALKQMMSAGGQAIAALRRTQRTNLSDERAAKLATTVTNAAAEVKKLLDTVKT